MEFAQQAITLEENAIISKNYDEKIIVPSGKTLMIEGETDRLIVNKGGTVIVKGTCNRIISMFGKVLVEENGFVANLYGLKCELTIKGKVNRLFVRDDTKCTLLPNCSCNTILNQDSTFNIDHDSYVGLYIQSGKRCVLDADENCYIMKKSIKKSIFR